jgi:hypothetical protein
MFLKYIRSYSHWACLKYQGTVKLVNFKHYNSNFSLNLLSKEKTFTQIYLVISKTLVICNLKEKSVL